MEFVVFVCVCLRVSLFEMTSSFLMVNFHLHVFASAHLSVIEVYVLAAIILWKFDSNK